MKGYWAGYQQIIKIYKKKQVATLEKAFMKVKTTQKWHPEKDQADKKQ